MDISDFPQSWDDNLNWDETATPSFRHFYAIYQAIGERQSLSLGDCFLPIDTNSIYEVAFYEHFLYDYTPKTRILLSRACESIAQAICCLYTYTERDKTFTYYGWSFNESNENRTLLSGAIGGAGDRSISVDFGSNNSFWWYDEYDTKYEQDISTNGAFPKRGFYLDNSAVLPKFDMSLIINDGDDIATTNHKLMKFLINCKSALNRLHRLFLKSITVDYSGGHTIYSYNLTNSKTLKSDFISSETIPSGFTLSGLIAASCVCTHYDADDLEDFNEEIINSLTYTPRIGSLKYNHLGALSAELYLHCYQQIRDNTANNWDGEYLTSFFDLGTALKKRGWNNLGIINPNSSIEIIPASWDSSTAYQSIADIIWNGGANRDHDMSFFFGIDGIMLDFACKGGFRFYDKGTNT